MSRFRIKIAIVVLTLCLTGCTERDELKLPVTIQFMMQFQQPVMQWHYEPTITVTELFNVDECLIGIRGIQFEGKREAGEDVFFETDPEITLINIRLTDPMTPATITYFEIPQGIYNYIKCEIFLRDILSGGSVGSNDIDFLNAGFIIKGKFEKKYFTDDDFVPSPEDYSIPFIMSIDDAEILNLSFSPEYNSGKIVIDRNKQYVAILYLDLNHVFKSISSESIENAEMTGEGSNRTVIISSEKNKNLYENLLFRLGQSSTVIIY
ncbi:MAG: hypothetical protein HPY62_08595 [Bacteroidales bacterium]|nr:hypothetical protein [Bacteroidales bacterium]